MNNMDGFTPLTDDEIANATGGAKDDLITVPGTITEVGSNATYKVQLQSGITIVAHVSGKLRMNYIRINTGDRVIIEMSPYDRSRGRITEKLKQ